MVAQNVDGKMHTRFFLALHAPIILTQSQGITDFTKDLANVPFL